MNEIERCNELDVDITISTSDLPAVIGSQVDKIKILGKSMQKAINSAENSKKSAEFANKKIGWFNRGTKEAVEQLQSSGRELATAVQNSAEALQHSFEFQKELANVSKYLFGLGAWNLAQNRTVVRELELKMKNATEEDISELARQELNNVIIQLKAQEDILHKQQEFNSRLRDFDQELKIFLDAVNDTEKKVKVQNEKLSELENSIRIYEEKINVLEEVNKLYNDNFSGIKASFEKQNIEINDLKNTIEKSNDKITLLGDENNKIKMKINIVIIAFFVLILILQVIKYFM